MAAQAGIGFSKFVLLVGAGLTGSVLLKNTRLSDILSEIQSLTSNLDRGGESSHGASDHVAALAAQVGRIQKELRQLPSGPIIVNSNSGRSGNLASLAMPAAMLGALGYGYMWWKGLSLSDFMYVTKRNVANVVASMTKHLDQLSEALAATKRHLTQRIENIDEKMDEQKELSKLIKNEVSDVRGDLSQIGFDIEEIQKMVCGLEKKIGMLDGKQDFANVGVAYLCRFVGGDKDGSMAKYLENMPAKASKMLPAPVYAEDNSLKGLQYIADTIQSGDFGKTNANASLQNEIDDHRTTTPPTGATRVQKSRTNSASLGRTIST
ncbi:hypothetical protein SUGI_0642990 [Cryptomeria japonica]|uniref:uncharacterized protein LOC131067998 n=1 Tax=Cryptomeria japonica TaxID=3369 RepID=UPI0024149C22|nr:uncharacterized protein LOC131067998 [Cryptomeria japonica]GLJ31943.1 hypothetical protein SUGI_0642990 [Cryptomeria japonica]